MIRWHQHGPSQLTFTSVMFRSPRLRHNDGLECFNHRNILHVRASLRSRRLAVTDTELLQLGSVSSGCRFLVCLRPTLRPGNILPSSQRRTFVN